MELGSRRIRSAGLGTGSVEVTLPAIFRDLAGTSLRVRLRDGLRPELVLQPELQAAHAAVEMLWLRLAIACAVATPAPLPAADFLFALFAPVEDADARPGIAWSDALALTRPPPHAPVIVARLTRALGARLHAPLGVGQDLAFSLGATMAFALTGQVLHAREQEACDIAGALLARHGLQPGAALHDAAEDAISEACWQGARSALAVLAEAHRQWTADPAQLAHSRAAWRRGIALELSGA